MNRNRITDLASSVSYLRTTYSLKKTGYVKTFWFMRVSLSITLLSNSLESKTDSLKDTVVFSIAVSGRRRCRTGGLSGDPRPRPAGLEESNETGRLEGRSSQTLVGRPVAGRVGTKPDGPVERRDGGHDGVGVGR